MQQAVTKKTKAIYDNLFLAEIARSLRIEQSRLYPRFWRLMARLRKSLESQGLAVEDIRAILGMVELGNGRSLPTGSGKKPDPGSST